MINLISVFSQNLILKNYYNSFVEDLNPLNSSFVNAGIPNGKHQHLLSHS